MIFLWGLSSTFLSVIYYQQSLKVEATVEQVKVSFKQVSGSPHMCGLERSVQLRDCILSLGKEADDPQKQADRKQKSTAAGV